MRRSRAVRIAYLSRRPEDFRHPVQGWARRSKRFTIGAYGPLTVDQARARAKELLAEIATGRGDPSQERKEARDAQTMAQLLDRYIEEHAKVHKRPSSIAGDVPNIKKHVRPQLGTLLVQEVTRQHLADLHSRMRATPTSANRVLSLVAKALQCAIEWGLIENNPARGIRKYRETRRDRFLSEPEFAKLGATLREIEAEGREDPFIIAAIRLLALSGLRLGEVLNLEWRDVDLERARLRLREAKTGTRAAIVNAPMLEIIQALWARRETAIQ